MKIFNVMTVKTVNDEEKVFRATVCATSEQMLRKANPDVEYVKVTDITSETLSADSVTKADTALQAAGFTDNERLVIRTLIEGYLADRVDGRTEKAKAKRAEKEKAEAEAKAKELAKETKTGKGKAKEETAA